MLVEAIRSSPPTLFSFASEEGEHYQADYRDDWHDEQDRSFNRRRQIGKQRVYPEKENIGAGSTLNDRGIRLTTRPERTKHDSAHGNCQKDRAGKENVLPHGGGDKGYAIFFMVSWKQKACGGPQRGMAVTYHSSVSVRQSIGDTEGKLVAQGIGF
jgi:hypothetical protein